MIFNQSRTWPHPVISPLTDDVSTGEFDFNLDSWPDHTRWRLKVEATIPDDTIQALLSSGKVCYLLHIECRRTYFRQVFKSLEQNFEVEILGDKLFGVVEASFFVVATRDIDAYFHPKQHADYKKAKFSVSIGEPLAVAVSKSFEAPLEADPILKLSSILDIKKGLENLRFMKVNCEGERIILELPPVEFDNYRSLRSDGTLRGLLANSVVLPGLLQSFHYLRDPDLDLNEFKATHRWGRRVLTKLEEMGIDLFSGESGGGVCLHAAQQLLRGPLRRSLDDLVKLFSEPPK